MELSKEIKALTEKNWFPIMMEELGYVKKEKAIPIEWIRKKADEWASQDIKINGKPYKFTTQGVALAIVNLVKEWEKENGTRNIDS